MRLALLTRLSGIMLPGNCVRLPSSPTAADMGSKMGRGDAEKSPARMAASGTLMNRVAFEFSEVRS